MLLLTPVVVKLTFIFTTENYRRLELEKKKNRIQKQVHRGSIIRYHSLTMPLIEELPPEPEINVDSDR